MTDEEKKDLAGSSAEESQPKKRAKWKKIVGGALTVLLVLALVLCLVVVLQIKRSRKPFLFGYATYFVLTGSMEPTIHVGEVILITRVESEEEIEKGDIVTFIGIGGTIDGLTVTHRVVSDGVENGMITTCGDANNGIPDEPVPFTNVIGKYAKTSAVLTFLYSIFTNKFGFLFLIFIPLVILLVVQVMDFGRLCRTSKKSSEPELTAEEITEQALKEREEEIRKKAIEEYLASLPKDTPPPPKEDDPPRDT